MRLALVVIVVGLLAPAVGAPGAAASRGGRHATRIVVDGRARGRTFDGVGAISGGGGNSRYLVDYPAASRREILDYLFAPRYGAALQVLKVEVGGDADSSDGAEASIEHRRGAVDCGAGYEWWLMREAKLRNPGIRLYGLAWAAPGWLGSFWSRKGVGYVVHWLRCARRNGLRIDYVGGNQNERRYRPRWTKALRRAMDRAGFRHTRIAVADTFDPHGRWAVARDLARHPALRRATSVVADHDICGYPTAGGRCRSTRTARRLRLPLWASELGGMEGNAGAAAFARAVIRGYPTARLVGFLAWPLMSAMPPGLPHQPDGLVSAKEPWSGHYEIRALTYAIAAVTWFTAPGWRYVGGANGPLGRTYAGGSYATLRARHRAAWTTIAETTTARSARRARFRIRGRLPARAVRVWRTNPSSGDPAAWMVRRRTLHPRRGRFGYRLRPGYVYTFTTLRRGARRRASSPPRRAFDRYEDRPGARSRGDAPPYLAAMDGAFEYAPCWDDRSGTCIEQMAPAAPVYWHVHRGFPYAVIGDPSLHDYTVASDVLLSPGGGSAGIIGRFDHRGRSVSNFDGYILDLDAGGGWRLIENRRSAGASVRAAGSLAGAAAGGWHRLAMTVDGPALTASIDGQPVAAIHDVPAARARGIAGIEAGADARQGIFTGTSWPVVQFRRLTISPLGR